MTRRAIVMGAGGFGRESCTWYLDTVASHGMVLGFLDDDESRHGEPFGGYTILGGHDELDRLDFDDVVIGVGAPRARRRVFELLEERKIEPVTVVHPTAVIGPRVGIGAGTIICPGVVITTDVVVGHAGLLNLNVTVGHDCRLGDFVVVAPGVDLAGNVSLHNGVDMGLGSAAIQGCEVGEWSIVGSGAVVVRSLPPHVTAVGVPAKVIKQHEPANSV